KKKKKKRGNFAVVRRVVRRSDEKSFAAKIVSKKHLSDEEKQEIHDEVCLLRREKKNTTHTWEVCCVFQHCHQTKTKQLNHPSIVKVIEVLDTPRHLYIVLELLTGGELFDRIVALGHFSEQEAAYIASQLAQALKYLHSQCIAHRDLK
ncbi:Calcium/calmodulin-dependent protein kinase I, isoform E, partial [Reticulomyxa filosa]